VRVNHLPDLIARLGGVVGDAVEESADQVEYWAKAFAPVETGALDFSIEARQLGPLSWEVSAGGPSFPHYVDYASYEEFGTRNNRAHFFMTRAGDLVETTLPETAETHIAILCAGLEV
jgi:hypothetical protein